MRTRWAGPAALALVTTAALISGGAATLADPVDAGGTVTSTAPLTAVSTPSDAVDSDHFRHTTGGARAGDNRERRGLLPARG